MYHATLREAPLDYFAVGASALEAQVKCLASRSSTGVTLEQCVAAPQVNQVAITFDDAHISNFSVAAPTLAGAGMTATIFVVSDWVGRRDYCSWSQLRELQGLGWSVQSHTASHPFLSTLSRDALQYELTASRREIEDRLGTSVRTLALPNGDWPQRSHRALIAEAGYDLVATSRWAPNAATLPMVDGVRVVYRHTVRRETSLQHFARIVERGPGPFSAEGLRLGLLSAVRNAMGVDRYRRWRRRLLGQRNPTPPTITEGGMHA